MWRLRGEYQPALARSISAMKLRWVAVLAVMVAATRSADAGPTRIATDGDLPSDLVVDPARGVLRSGDVEVSLRDLLVHDPSDPGDGCEVRFAGARYDRAGGALELDELGCTGGPIIIPRRRVVAALARASSQAAEARRDLTEAQRYLVAALAAEPDNVDVARDLARVQLARGDRARAMATLRPFVAQAPIAHYAAYLSTAVFAPLLDEPELAGLRAKAPGRAKVRAVGQRLIAHSATHDLFAAIHEMPIGDSCQGDRRDVALAILDRSGRTVTTFSLLPPRLLEKEWTDRDLRRHAKPIAARMAAANRFLRDLGFEPAGEIAPFAINARGARVARFPGAHLGIAERDGTLRLLDGDRALGEHHLYRCPRDRFSCEYPPALQWAAWLPSLRIILVSWQASGAEHSDRTAAIDVWQRPAP
jgi:hypothetical protein